MWNCLTFMGHDIFTCDILIYMAHDLYRWDTTHSYVKRHTATHCNTLQHTATHCNTQLILVCDATHSYVKRLTDSTDKAAAVTVRRLQGTVFGAPCTWDMTHLYRT